MVLLLRILAVLAALEGIGGMMVMMASDHGGAGPFTIIGRVLDPGIPSLTLALVTHVVADLLAAKKLKENMKD
ncbi:hypothetical protein [Aquidulcibacter sp.]|uniref:hypothetical protein n=1 Tax=Aquidulcibacter sp. TaxID=2052990 RepID=UPI0025C2213F|nr:hypothetical protein [Aquidulcibacter sp.]MCA3697277.1 hypothetical protein [Aquidulcibacter sp.]